MDINKFIALLVYLGGFAVIPILLKSFFGLLNSLTGGAFNNPTKGVFDRARNKRQERQKMRKTSKLRDKKFKRGEREIDLRSQLSGEELTRSQRTRRQLALAPHRWRRRQAGGTFFDRNQSSSSEAAPTEEGLSNKNRPHSTKETRRRRARRRAEKIIGPRMTPSHRRQGNVSWEDEVYVGRYDAIDKKEKQYDQDPNMTPEERRAIARDSRRSSVERTAATSVLTKHGDYKVIRELHQSTNPTTKAIVREALKRNAKDVLKAAPDLLSPVYLEEKATADKAKEFDMTTWQKFFDEASVEGATGTRQNLSNIIGSLSQKGYNDSPSSLQKEIGPAIRVEIERRTRALFGEEEARKLLGEKESFNSREARERDRRDGYL